MSEKEKRDLQLWRNHNRYKIHAEMIIDKAKLRYERHKKDRSDTWFTNPNIDYHWFEVRLLEELGEFLIDPSSEEAADVLNFMAFILARIEAGLK